MYVSDTFLWLWLGIFATKKRFQSVAGIAIALSFGLRHRFRPGHPPFYTCASCLGFQIEYNKRRQGITSCTSPSQHSYLSGDSGFFIASNCTETSGTVPDFYSTKLSLTDMQLNYCLSRKPLTANAIHFNALFTWPNYCSVYLATTAFAYRVTLCKPVRQIWWLNEKAGYKRGVGSPEI